MISFPQPILIQAFLLPKIPVRQSDVRVIYGDLYFLGPNKAQSINQFTDDVMTGIRAAYHHDAMNALRQGGQPPSAAVALPKIKQIITAKVQEKKSSGKGHENP
jgi:hypothetical protein